jgi:thiosulfate/3-mercaptopyruvate sulfurtransferase
MPYTTLVSTETLAANLQSDWVVVDCRFDLANEGWGREQYEVSHIPGAVYASLNHDMAGERTGRNGRHPLPSIESLAATFGRLGIANGAQVVVHDQDVGLHAGRLWWSLRYLGHDAVALLDGGLAKWVAEGRPMRSGAETRATTSFTPAPRVEMHVGIDAVQARMGDGRTLLVDARGPERFEGKSETIDKVAGHIPGAHNHFYKWNVKPDGTMLPADELRARFETLLDGRAPSEMVMYCGSGVSACHNLLAMEHAGLSGTPLYVGSWSEWSADRTRPVETGPAGTNAQGPRPKAQTGSGGKG